MPNDIMPIVFTLSVIKLSVIKLSVVMKGKLYAVVIMHSVIMQGAFIQSVTRVIVVAPWLNPYLFPTFSHETWINCVSGTKL